MEKIVVEQEVVVVITETSGVVVTGIMGPPGAAGIQNISDASDVDFSNRADGSLLVYSTQNQKWVATTQLENQNIESGQY